MEVSLNHLRPGMVAQVSEVLGCGGVSTRLRSFGLEPGARLQCCGRSINGQVTALMVNGICIQLQTRDLEKIRVRL